MFCIVFYPFLKFTYVHAILNLYSLSRTTLEGAAGALRPKLPR